MAPSAVGSLNQQTNPATTVKNAANPTTAIGTRPKMLLLDEVAAGFVPQEVDEISTTIQFVHRELDITVVLIEHVMEMVTRLCGRVIVLDYGRKIAEGEPAAVMAEPAVIKAYLGAKYAREYSGKATS